MFNTTPITFSTITPTKNKGLYVQIAYQLSGQLYDITPINGFVDLSTIKTNIIAYKIHNNADPISSGLSTARTTSWTTMCASFKHKY